MSKKKIYLDGKKKIPDSLKNDLDKFNMFTKGKNICHKYRHCDKASLADIPYNSKFFIKEIKGTVVEPLFAAFEKKNSSNNSKSNLTTRIKNKALSLL